MTTKELKKLERDAAAAKPGCIATFDLRQKRDKARDAAMPALIEAMELARDLADLAEPENRHEMIMGGPMAMARFMQRAVAAMAKLEAVKP